MKHSTTQGEAGFCCDRMKSVVEYRCEMHPDPYDCPDNFVSYIPKFDEFGLIVHNGGSSSIAINFCPWCGKSLPESKRDRWFDELESMGIDPAEDDVPSRYQTDEWFRSQ